MRAAAGAAPPLRDDCFALPPGVDWTPVSDAQARLREGLACVRGPGNRSRRGGWGADSGARRRCAAGQPSGCERRCGWLRFRPFGCRGHAASAAGRGARRRGRSVCGRGAAGSGRANPDRSAAAGGRGHDRATGRRADRSGSRDLRQTPAARCEHPSRRRGRRGRGGGASRLDVACGPAIWRC